MSGIFRLTKEFFAFISSAQFLQMSLAHAALAGMLGPRSFRDNFLKVAQEYLLGIMVLVVLLALLDLALLWARLLIYLLANGVRVIIFVVDSISCFFLGIYHGAMETNGMAHKINRRNRLVRKYRLNLPDGR